MCLCPDTLIQTLRATRETLFIVCFSTTCAAVLMPLVQCTALLFSTQKYNTSILRSIALLSFLMGLVNTETEMFIFV